MFLNDSFVSEDKIGDSKSLDVGSNPTGITQEWKSCFLISYSIMRLLEKIFYQLMIVRHDK